MTVKTRQRRWQLSLLPIALVLVVFVLWASIIPAPMTQAIVALQPDAQVSIQTEPWLVFQPAGREPTTGLILYPGGRVDYRSYAPVARAIAAEGYLVAVVPMPLNLAILGAERAKGVMDAFPTIRHWAVGGHSLGGTMAAQFARKHPDLVQGLVLWASYPANADNLSTANLKVLSLYGTQDGVSTPERIEASRALLPANTRFVAIEGANHGQFGWYGAQYGDNAATITREAQQAQVVAATVELLRELPQPAITIPPDAPTRAGPQLDIPRQRNYRVDLAEQPDKMPDETQVIVTFIERRPVDLREHGIDEADAAELRSRLSAFAEDWDSPEMSIYDHYDAAKTQL